MKARRILIILLIIVIICFYVTNTSSVNTLNELAYVVAMGLDVGNNGKIKLTLQIALPSSSNSGNSGGSSSSSGSDSGQSSGSIINTVECNTIDSGISLINSYISKKVNFSHCKVAVFSEELACKGISNYVCTLTNNIEVRPTCNILISKCTALYFLKNSKPLLDQLSSKYYELESSSEKNTGYTQIVTLQDFYNDYYDTFGEPYAILGSINGASSNNISNNSSSSSINDDADYTASELAVESPKNIENLRARSF